MAKTGFTVPKESERALSTKSVAPTLSRKKYTYEDFLKVEMKNEEEIKKKYQGTHGLEQVLKRQAEEIKRIEQSQTP